MSVIVKGIFEKEMPMPQEGYVDIRLHFKGGRIECATMPIGNPPYYATFKVVDLPPHGDLVDLSDAVHPNDSMRRMTIDEQLRRTCEGWSADKKQYVVIEAEGET